MTSRLRITLFCCLALLFVGAASAQDSLSIGANVTLTLAELPNLYNEAP